MFDEFIVINFTELMNIPLFMDFLDRKQYTTENALTSSGPLSSQQKRHHEGASYYIFPLATLNIA